MSVRCQMNCLGPEETKTKLYFDSLFLLGRPMLGTSATSATSGGCCKRQRLTWTSESIPPSIMLLALTTACLNSI